MTSIDFNFAEPIASLNRYDYENDDCYPVDIGDIKVSQFIVLNSRPYKVVEVAHSKPGKHGHAKSRLVGIDLFTGKRIEEVRPCGQVVQAPNVKKTDYLLVNIDKDKYLTLMNEATCQLRSDLRLKTDHDLGAKIYEKFKNGEQLKVTVLKALDEEAIINYKVVVE
ncbi:unnamed protein product [Didymodactylos carnosus]|uniref:Eukaryotic translation initiation factor 5A n=1 Tax=Didymodactylos carnosus TaxID=1234261 RepID=A0A814GNM3_9BILA|nr:unnamed protein product [Didymodactylos carnosus]CAF0998647.1 unnamed protein product [Didymodactylos carnosus]CAF3617340.1 unnamed protein product [Didymodactylos carnosus]CAF3770130.1 unnamed protein product [Didymodactylos carnosus]